ncbi:2-oxoglutarate dehydrogenase complex dihydrolipoyllysine-residue succinyltransferase [Alphaproteobacteria bacterium]|nr:2-oxoglutarate dehydrogenase complex dihydrolipoyllysine-residue succinyltransferase [Alphaproteobacteria bacterium]
MKEIVIPALGESVTEATIAQWLKAEGDPVQLDETILELETDKVTLEVNAVSAGVMSSIQAKSGDTVTIGQVVGQIDDKAKVDKVAAAPPKASNAGGEKADQKAVLVAPQAGPVSPSVQTQGNFPLSPSVKRMAQEAGLAAQGMTGTGKDGRLTKGDLLKAPAQNAAAGPAPAPAASVPISGQEEIVPMSRLRQTISKRLKSAQETAAILNTFNEVDMSNVMALRSRMQDSFQKKHGIKLGFMSFFVKACVVALKEIPAVNAEIRGTDIIYKNHYDVSVAIGTPKGLVVPVLRGADQKSFAGIEGEISQLAVRAREGTLSMDDMMGGSFSITNGGVYGSMLSTPILNPPQSGILGMHSIQKRPVVVGDKVEIRPIMYLALSYDHRIIDGRDAVTFLVRVKQCIEDPERILLDA